MVSAWRLSSSQAVSESALKLLLHFGTSTLCINSDGSRPCTVSHCVGSAQHLPLLLCRLYIVAPGFPGPLPDIQPGALQRLKDIQLMSPTLTALPPSWGGDPAVLPALQVMSLVMHFMGPLPAAWSRGFRELRSLTVGEFGFVEQHILDSIATATKTSEGSAAKRVLPPDWAAGFPRLRHLELDGLHISSSVPAGWITFGFPSLATL